MVVASGIKEFQKRRHFTEGNECLPSLVLMGRDRDKSPVTFGQEFRPPTPSPNENYTVFEEPSIAVVRGSL